MSGSHRNYITFRNSRDRCHFVYADTDPYDNEDIKRFDHTLQQVLTGIFSKRYLTSGQMKKVQNSIFKLVLELKPGLRKMFPKKPKLSLLWFAVLYSYQNSAELLVRTGADVNKRCGMKLVDDYNYNVNEKTSILHLLLQMYPSSWNKRFLDLVTDHGADLQAQDSRGDTALHYAVRFGRAQATELLLEKGALVNVAAINGKTPLLVAARTNEADQLLPLLLNCGADATVRDTTGMNALHHLACASVDHADLARVLIEKRVSLYERDFLQQLQPLHLAVINERTKLVKLYLDYGADVNARAENDGFPLHFAVDKDTAVMLTLLKSGANIDLKTIDGRTALHSACQQNEKTIGILLSVGADMFVEDRDGKTPFSLMDISFPSIRMMLKTLALKEACLMQPTIELKDERQIKQYPQLWDYYQGCIEEIRKTKSTRFIETCTFFDLLTKCQCQIAALMRNREFENKFRRYDLNAVFSCAHYAKDILEAFERAQRYYHSMLEQEDAINEAIYYILPHMVVRKVTRYILGCEECELKKIVHASRSAQPKSL